MQDARQRKSARQRLRRSLLGEDEKEGYRKKDREGRQRIRSSRTEEEKREDRDRDRGKRHEWTEEQKAKERERHAEEQRRVRARKRTGRKVYAYSALHSRLLTWSKGRKGPLADLARDIELVGFSLVPFPVADVDSQSMVRTGGVHNRFNTIHGETSRLTKKLGAVPASVKDAAATLLDTIKKLQGVSPHTRGEQRRRERLPLVQQGYALLHSLPGGQDQVLHRDISPVELNHRAQMGQSLDMSIVVALEDDVRVNVLPGSHVLSHGEWHSTGLSEVPIQVQVPCGHALLFLSSLVHGGAAYQAPNTRLHFYISLGLSRDEPIILWGGSESLPNIAS